MYNPGKACAAALPGAHPPLSEHASVAERPRTLPQRGRPALRSARSVFSLFAVRTRRELEGEAAKPNGSAASPSSLFVRAKQEMERGQKTR
jgi:hypothetical protein